MNRRTFHALVLTTIVAVLAMATIGRAGAASAPHEARVSAPERTAGAVPIPVSGAQSGVPLFIGAGVASNPGMLLMTNWDDFVRLVRAPSPSLVAAVYEFYMQGGSTALVLPTGSEDAPTLGAALTAVTPVGPRAPVWDLIVIPALSSLSPTDWLTTATHMTATATAAKATALLDPPDSTVALTTSGDAGPLTDLALQLRRAVTSPGNAVLLSSGLVGIVTPINPQQPTVVSGAAVLAGAITVTDLQQGVWTAPGGPGRTVFGLEPVMTVDDTLGSELASPGAINSWRVFPGSGTILSGDMTLQGAGYDRWITQQRLTSWISRSVEPSLEAAAFESNDPTLWGEVTAGISTFLTSVWQQGGLIGAAPDDAFKVVVGLETMSPQDVADGLLKVNVQLYFYAVAAPVLAFQQQVGPGS